MSFQEKISSSQCQSSGMLLSGTLAGLNLFANDVMFTRTREAIVSRIQTSQKERKENGKGKNKTLHPM